ncbi:hypothetical protein HPP92_005350 [Vanilla planifolia]|uniref:1-phosphatidylinositol-3-phosphate 5-kinase n=1 Tax=Vanilla planifolia TaxID=51239 RepID=A0A835RTB7_VANPL|nr:hypothetical protein HPP92_005350 [Vanilla planifolia]
MDQEKDALKFVNEMIESCHPNLVLVEKSVSRDIQEFLLAKGMTLAIDMKLTRLERIARCTGSHVVSSADYMTGRYVKQCDTFRIEKFLEEHNNSSEVGRKSSKTLMFLEGFAKPLGCTILLKGAPTDELKRVKRVIQYTVFAAYHLILETSFFADQRALFCKMHASSEIDGPLTDETLPTITSVAAPSSNSYCLVHSSNGFLENSAYKDDPEFVPTNDFFEDKVTQGELPSDIANQNVLITAVRTSTNECDSKDDNDNILSPESILVLLSSQCIEKGLVCEQSHLSRIKYYGNFDISLGRYLQDVLLNQQHSCSSCGEPPEAHIYCYTHQNGNLTVLVKQLPSSLSGEAEGKIWMWSRCLKCEHEKGIPRSTTRVVMSSAARSLSFGKFLELSFTSHSAASRLCSECGHSLHRDCLRFFGLGSKVAMFRYSPVEIYAACKPLPVLEFANPSRQEWVALETKSVIQNVDSFFSEVASFLHNLKISCPGLVYKQSLNFPGIVKSIAEVEEMLNQEKVEFEASLLKIHNFTGELEKPVNEIPIFSWFYQELIFWLYIWDSRLHQLLQCSKDLDGSLDMNVRYIDRASKKNCDIASLETTHIQKSLSNCECNDQTHYKLRHDSLCNSVGISQSSEIKETGFSTKGVGFDQLTAEDAIATIKQDNDSVTCVLPAKGNEDCSTYEHMHEDCFLGSSELFVKAANSDMLSGSRISENGFPSPSLLKEQHSGTRLLEDSSTSVLGDPDSLIWVPFPELRKAFRMDLCGGYLQKFEFTRTYIPKYLSPRHHLFPQERGLLHYHFPSNGNIICVSENEISSVIACALALSEEQHCFMDTIVEKDAIVDKPEGDKENDSASTFQSECSSSSLYWQSNGSLDSVGGIHHTWSLSSLSLDELSTSASESTVS